MLRSLKAGTVILIVNIFVLKFYFPTNIIFKDSVKA